MGCFQVRYGSSVVIYERKLFIKLATANGVTSGQSYKHFMLVNYDSRVVPDLKIRHITTLESKFTSKDWPQKLKGMLRHSV